MEAAFKPQVFGELDTQNFMKFDEVRYYDLGMLLFFISVPCIVCNTPSPK